MGLKENYLEKAHQKSEVRQRKKYNWLNNLISRIIVLFK